MRRILFFGSLSILLLASAVSFGLLWMESQQRQSEIKQTVEAMEALKPAILEAKAANPFLKIDANVISPSGTALQDPISQQDFLVEPENLKGPDGQDILLLQPVAFRVGMWPGGETAEYALLEDGSLVDLGEVMAVEEIAEPEGEEVLASGGQAGVPAAKAE